MSAECFDRTAKHSALSVSACWLGILPSGEFSGNDTRFSMAENSKEPFTDPVNLFSDKLRERLYHVFILQIGFHVFCEASIDDHLRQEIGEITK